MTTVDVSTLIKIAKSAASHHTDGWEWTSRAFAAQLIGHISVFSEAEADELALALGAPHLTMSRRNAARGADE